MKAAGCWNPAERNEAPWSSHFSSTTLERTMRTITAIRIVFVTLALGIAICIPSSIGVVDSI